MTELRKNDFLIEVAKGNIAGHSLVHKFGRNEAVGATWEHISLNPFDTADFLTTPTAVFLQGTLAADGPGGAGAREVTVQGILSLKNEGTAVITTNGATSTPATTEEFYRVHRAWVSSCGTYTAANVSVVIVSDAVASNTMITIGEQEGQSYYAGYTIPTGKTGYLLAVNITIDGVKTSDVRMRTREDMTDSTAPVEAVREKYRWIGLSGDLHFDPQAPSNVLAADTDIWFEAQATATATVAVDFEILLVDD
jgi:hypothetical protein